MLFSRSVRAAAEGSISSLLSAESHPAVRTAAGHLSWDSALQRVIRRHPSRRGGAGRTAPGPPGAPRRGAERAAPHVPAWGDRRHTSPGRYNEHPEVQNSIHDILLFLCRKGFDTHGHANVCEKSTSEHEKLSQKARGNGTAWGGGRGAGGQEWRRRSRGRTLLPRPSFGNLRVFCLIKNKDKTSTPKY